jgi:phosphoribosylaminoimidazolecarboxamide formyltransferase/IMP cyclohydrolase
VKGNSTVGIGAGQTLRKHALKLAIEAAGKAHAQGSVLASEAAFDTIDCVQAAIDAGVLAIIQPGGAEIDAQAIELCDKAGVAMVFTGMRHFRH